jgi:hypothetical protein
MLGLFLLFLDRSIYGWPSQKIELISRGLYLGGPLLYATLGLLIAVRQAHNPIGWLALGVALSAAVQGVAEGYALYNLALHPGAWPGGVLMGWIAQWSWAPPYIGFSLIILLFPTGRLLSPRWRPVAWIAVAFGLLCLVLGAIGPGIITTTNDAAVRFANPLSLIGDEALYERIFGSLFGSFFPLLFLTIMVSVILRFRRAQGQERQQLKWFAYAVVWAVADASFGSYLFRTWSLVTSNLTFYGVVAAIGLAILRYRLYDIDLIIRRTLQYSVLSVVLALLYLGSVVLLQILFHSVVGLGQNQLATVFSTLAIAAFFKPLRTRVQSSIDRHFYRRRYDAEQVLAAFATTCREEVELAGLTDELLRVVRETIQPTQASLWLRKPERGL